MCAILALKNHQRTEILFLLNEIFVIVSMQKNKFRIDFFSNKLFYDKIKRNIEMKNKQIFI